MKGSYSQLITDISSGNVYSIILVPDRREVIVRYNDGQKSVVPIFFEDQKILRIAEEFSVPLTVEDLRSEQALASVFTTVGLFLVFIFGLSFIISKSSKIIGPGGFIGSKAKLHLDESVTTTFDDVAGLNEETEELREVVSFLNNYEKLSTLGGKAPKGVLLVGPPGTGKTLLAKAIAGEAGVPFFSISGSAFVELFVGVGASRVRELFKKAKENAPCIVFIDEIDSVGRQRGAGIGGGNDEREQTLNQLLTEMDGFSDNCGIVVLAATNRADVLDSALTRPGRFDRRIFIDLPNKSARLDILSIHIRSKPFNDEISLSEIANRTSGFSGAELMNLLNEAAIITARNGKDKLGMEEVDKALEKLTVGICTKSVNDITNKRHIAYHEIGKVLVAHYLPFSEKVDKITILKSPSSLGGMSYFKPDEDIIESGLVTKSYLYNKIVISLAGRASELLIYGRNEITQISQIDLQNVHYWAKEMAKSYGFSQLGPLSFESKNSDIFLGREIINRSTKYSQITMRKIDSYILDLCKKALEEATDILSDKRILLDELVDIILEVETINSDQFYKLINEYENKK